MIRHYTEQRSRPHGAIHPWTNHFMVFSLAGFFLNGEFLKAVSLLGSIQHRILFSAYCDQGVPGQVNWSRFNCKSDCVQIGVITRLNWMVASGDGVIGRTCSHYDHVALPSVSVPVHNNYYHSHHVAHTLYCM